MDIQYFKNTFNNPTAQFSHKGPSSLESLGLRVQTAASKNHFVPPDSLYILRNSKIQRESCNPETS